jgi:hypothetical protein
MLEIKEEIEVRAPEMQERRWTMRVKLIYFISILVCTVFVGCATMPSIQVNPPWRRILSSQEAVKPGAKLKIEAFNTASPMLGKEDLAITKVRDTLTGLLLRRGFIAETTDYDYIVKLNYKTERNDKLRMSSFYGAANYGFDSSSIAAGSAAYQGLGVSAARLVSQRATASATNASFAVDQELSYTHTVSIEIMNRPGMVIWKGDTMWEESNLNIISNIVPAVQMIVSSLPTIQTVKPEIGEIKESHDQNFYTMKCLEHEWFACPALPFKST